jgi:hypothetical protein
MAANFSYFVNKKIVISMLNCYCREHLIFLMVFVALTSRLALNTLHSRLHFDQAGFQKHL